MNWEQIILFLIQNWDKVVKPFLSLINLTDLKNLFIKGDKNKMDNNLFYEVFNATATSEIKNAYDTVVANNRKYYRCFTQSGKIIGWYNNKHISEMDARNNHPDIIVDLDGQTWFINPEYKEPEPSVSGKTEEPAIAVAKAVEEPVSPVEPINEEVKVNVPTKEEKPTIAPVESIKRSAEETASVIADMMKRYTDICDELEAEKRKGAEKDKMIADLQKRVSEAEKRADDLDEEEESAVDKLDEMREAAKTIWEFIRSVQENE